MDSQFGLLPANSSFKVFNGESQQWIIHVLHCSHSEEQLPAVPPGSTLRWDGFYFCPMDLHHKCCLCSSLWKPSSWDGDLTQWCSTCVQHSGNVFSPHPTRQKEADFSVTRLTLTGSQCLTLSHPGSTNNYSKEEVIWTSLLQDAILILFYIVNYCLPYLIYKLNLINMWK